MIVIINKIYFLDGDAAHYSNLLSFDQSSSPSASQSTSSQSTSRHSIFSSRTSSVPFLRRQARLPDRQELIFDQSKSKQFKPSQTFHRQYTTDPFQPMKVLLKIGLFRSNMNNDVKVH